MNNSDYTEPDVYGLFPHAAELLRLKKENRDKLYNEYPVWLNIYSANAKKATMDETNDLIRGAKITMHMLSNIPVEIKPYETIATYSIIPYDQDDLAVALEELKKHPAGTATRAHIAFDFKKLLKKGIKGIQAEIDAKIHMFNENATNQTTTDEATLRKITFYKATKLSLDAVLCYANRFKAEALHYFKSEKNANRRIELKRLANALENVPFKPAASFFEALQSLMLYYFCIRLTCNGEPNSVGRLDYILDDYYKRDLSSGAITKVEACRLLQEPRIKSSILNGQSDSYILAGSNPDGTPFWNDLTYFILDTTKELPLQGPQIWFRYAQGQPRSLLRRAFQPLRAGITHPGFFNDAVTIPAMIRSGYTIEHARDYVCCQCVELSSQGRSNILSGYGYYNLAKPIEILMNGGKAIIEEKTWLKWHWEGSTPKNIPLDFNTFDDFKKSYEMFLRYLLKEVVRYSNDSLSQKSAVSYTITSAFIEGCLEKGVFANEGGAIYNQTAPNFTGVITAADSLAAIKQYVYDEKKATLSELADMCRNNFTGNENARLYLLNQCPKYGNGDASIDSLVSWIMEIIDDELLKQKNIYGDVFMAQYFGWKTVDEHSYTLAATPDGRLFGETPSGTLGGDLGRERKGMTALLNSVTSFDHKKAPGGLNVNLRIGKTLLTTDADVEKMIDLLLTYFENGGMEVQINCVSKETLIAAQKNPEKYTDLNIRVSGQSLYFVELGKALQDQIINRVEHTG